MSSDLTAIDDDELEARRAAAAARLREMLERGIERPHLQAVYRDEVLPLEKERVRRAGLRRSKVELLFVTVGAQADAPALAILGTPAKTVVLLHSEGNEQLARRAASDAGVEVGAAIPRSVGDGKQPEKLYQVVMEEWSRAGRPPNVAIDLTGGFKAMSAAAQAAATFLGAEVRYVEAEQPGGFWVDERVITLTDPITHFAVLEREQGAVLLREAHWYSAHRHFAALQERTCDPADEVRSRIAGGLYEIERLGFERAEEHLSRAARMLRSPTLAGSRLASLAERVELLSEGAGRLRDLLVTKGGVDPSHELALDLIEHLIQAARRRLAAGESDLASLYGYRAMETVLQRRFRVRSGQDADKVDWQALTTTAGLTLEELRKRYNETSPSRPMDLESLPPGIGRDMLYRLMGVIWPDDVCRVDDVRKVDGIASARNRSVLAHGFKRIEDKEAERLISQAEDMRDRTLDVEHVEKASRERLRARHVFPSPDELTSV